MNVSSSFTTFGVEAIGRGEHYIYNIVVGVIIYYLYFFIC